MLRHILGIALSLLLLSGCTDGFKGYFKRSANNKLIDTKGFEGGKRRPLYNRKYISLAKKNVVEDNLDEDDGDLDETTIESPSSSKANREMYIDMAKREAAKKKNRSRMQKYQESYSEPNNNDETYPSLAHASEKSKGKNYDDQELQKELSEIKSMLHDAKKDLAKYKCPTNQNSSNTNNEITKSVRPAATKAKQPRLKEKFIEEVGEEIILEEKSRRKASSKYHDI